MRAAELASCSATVRKTRAAACSSDLLRILRAAAGSAFSPALTILAAWAAAPPSPVLALERCARQCWRLFAAERERLPQAVLFQAGERRLCCHPRRSL